MWFYKKNLLKCLEVFLLSLFKGVNSKAYPAVAISLRSFGPFNPFCPGSGGGVTYLHKTV